MELDITILVRLSDFLGKLIGKNRGFTDHKIQKYLQQNVRSDLEYLIKNFGMTSDSGQTYHIKIPGLGEIQDNQINNDIYNIREAWRILFRLFLKKPVTCIRVEFYLGFYSFSLHLHIYS